jgi:hypothetical protein
MLYLLGRTTSKPTGPSIVFGSFRFADIDMGFEIYRFNNLATEFLQVKTSNHTPGQFMCTEGKSFKAV